MANERSRAELMEEIDRVLNLVTLRERRDFVEMIRPYGLTLAQLTALIVLKWEERALSLSEVCDLTLTPPSSMTHTIDRLVERGFLNRLPHPSDRRTILVSLTEEGDIFTADILDRQKRHFQETCEGLTNRDLTNLLAILEKMDAQGRKLAERVESDGPRR
jgi:DNA-binding MarR family transcriptional regulator